jgi:hypothetical protein
VAPPPLTEEQIVTWAVEHHQRTGEWPSRKSGPVPGTDETWNAIVLALKRGRRGLPGGDALGRLLTRHGLGSGPGRPWTAEEDGWVRSLPTEEVVRRTGRTAVAVKDRQNLLARAGGA